jgi:hypothetical protein
MHTSFKKLTLICGLALALHFSLPHLQAQQSEDNEDPKFVNISPANGTVIAATEVTITGQIEDQSPVVVSVGERRTNADAKGLFTLKGVPIKTGENTITLVATDAAGNTEEQDLDLVGKDMVPPAAPVVFSIKAVTRLSYQMVEGRSEPESRIVISGGAKTALADAAYGTGLFTAFVQLREGKNDLIIVALDQAGASQPVSVSINRTSAGGALPPYGQAAQINISSGAAQRALPGMEFPQPLVALVSDARGLPVADVRVEFTVRFGDARFAGGLERYSTTTDEKGHARAWLAAGKGLSISLVRADFDGNTSSPAAFDLETFEPRSDNETSVSGLVLDTFKHPQEGFTVRLGETTAKTGRDGRFVMNKVKPGKDQRLEVLDEQNKSSALPWSDASYSIDVIAGADNNLGRPLFVTQLNEGPLINAGPPFFLDSEGRVGKGAAVAWQDDYEREVVPEVTLLTGVRITVKPPAQVAGQSFSATRVLSERVPVTLDDGLVTGLYFFVQPRLASFVPALTFKVPNADKLPPRSRVLIMRYDSQAGSWLREGMARVSDDGKVVMNEEGSGISRGGWYAFPSELRQPEFTNVDYIQIEGNPRFEGTHISHVEAYAHGKTAVLATAWGDYEFKRLHFRVSVPAMNGDAIFDNQGLDPGDSTREVAVTVTPGAQVMEPGDKLIVLAVGRPHPAGYYVWASEDPSIASVEPFQNDGGAEHPNRANVFARRPGKVRITVMYVTPAGVTAVGASEIICRLPR